MPSQMGWSAQPANCWQSPEPYAALCCCRAWQVLGTPSREEIHAMNPNYTEFKFPQVEEGVP